MNKTIAKQGGLVMKAMLRTMIVLSFLVFAVAAHAELLNSFDEAPADTNYWEWYDPVQEGSTTSSFTGHYATSTNADSSLGWIVRSYNSTDFVEGSASMQIEYSVHNSEAWGGYTKLHHFQPDSSSFVTYDWSLYDSISFAYNNIVPQDSLSRVHLRLNLCDYDLTATGGDTSFRDLGEFFYSFQYILDNEPGWNYVTIALERGDSWGGDNFTYTGWSGQPGNGEVDRDKIKGFSFEFSVSGAGEGDVVTGTILMDDFKLTGSQNELTNPGFELDDVNDDEFGWGVANAGEGAAHTVVVEDAAMARTGNKYASLGVENGAAWGVFYTEGTIPATMGETWEMGGYIKDLTEGGAGGAFIGWKLEGKDADGNILDNTGDILFETTDEYGMYTGQMVMPEGTAQVSGVIVVTRWDGSNCEYAVDDVYLMNLGNLDTEPPVAPTGVDAIPSTFYNLVTWADVPDEAGESYTVYASLSEITDLEDPAVDVVASGVLGDVQTVVHYLYTPLDDEVVEYYYAVACTDASQNQGEAGAAAAAVSNTAKGIPTIVPSAPPGFVADGFLDEWAGYPAFFLGVSDNSWGTPHVIGTVDNDDDLSGTIYIAVDESYLYIAADVIDNDYDGFYGEGNWWEHDAFELFFGLYDQRGPRHSGFMRGSEPDYKLVFTNDEYIRDVSGGYVMGTNGDGMYYFEGFDPDYVVEVKVPLDSLATGNGFTDDIFVAAEGMRIPIEPTFHDRDGADTWEGNVVASPINQDNAWQTPSVWSHTFVWSPVGVDDEAQVAYSYRLGANYPNPFNPTTTIHYEIAQAGEVKMVLYNVLGQQVMTLVNEVQSAGSHQISFNGADLATGIYLYTMEAGDFHATQKMILMK